MSTHLADGERTKRKHSEQLRATLAHNLEENSTRTETKPEARGK